MSIIEDIMFVDRVRPYVKRFKACGNNRWNMRCPFCGDSKKEHKARGWIHKSPDLSFDSLLYGCFNCGVSTTLGKLIEYLDPMLYNEYRLSAYREKSVERDEPKVEISVDESFFTKSSRELQINNNALDALICITELPDDHSVIKYLQDRKIPKNLWQLFYYTKTFKKYTNSLLPKKFETLDRDHPRLVLPFWDENKQMIAFAGRALNGEEPKYLTIKLDESEEKIYGRERLDFNKTVLVVEGQIDSILLPNALAVSGSSFDTPFIRSHISNVILVPDNEPRNAQITKLYRKYITAGYRVCMLPESFKFKDINEAIIGGMTSEQITQIINDNSYRGMAAAGKFMIWNKSDPKYNKPAQYVPTINLTNISNMVKSSLAFR